MAEIAGTAGARGQASDAKVIGLVSAAHFISHFFLLLLPPLFVQIKAEFGVGYAELALPITAFSLASALLQTPAGFLVDRLGARKMLIGGLTVGSAVVALAAVAPAFWMIVALFAVLGVANTVYHPADYAILSQACGTSRIGRAFSVHTFSGLLGTAAAPASMLLLGHLLGWRGAVGSAAALGLAVALVLLVSGNAFAASRRAAPKVRPAAQAVGWRLLLSAPILANLAFFMFIAISGGGISNFAVVALGALYGTPLEIANLALSAFLFLSAFGVLLGGYVADRTEHHSRVAAAGFAASALAILAVGTIDLDTIGLVTVMALAGLCSGVIMPSRDMIVRAVTPPGAFGKVFGFVTTGFNIGGVVAPPIFGWLMDEGSPRAIFLLVVACTVGAVLTVTVGAPRRASVGRA